MSDIPSEEAPCVGSHTLHMETLFSDEREPESG